jgi:hypothetical protein
MRQPSEALSKLLINMGLQNRPEFEFELHRISRSLCKAEPQRARVPLPKRDWGSAPRIDASSS